MTDSSTPILRWRYTLNGDVRHYVNVKDGRALCGLWPWPDATDRSPMWYGTASKLEYDTITKLPPCKHCLDVYGKAGPR